MVRKSNHKTSLLARIGDAVQMYQEATDEVDEAAAHILGVNRTDLRCLSVLARVESISPSELATIAGLTRGAMTTVLDRIEAAGLARRTRDAEDRRGVRVQLTAGGKERIGKLYGPIAREGAKVLDAYTAPELEAILRFLDEGQRLQETHAEWLRRLAGEPVATARKTVRRSART